FKLSAIIFSCQRGEEVEVEEILDYRFRGRGLQYLIKWKGFPDEENSWEPVKNIHAPRFVKLFHRNYPVKPSKGVQRPSPGRGQCKLLPGCTVRCMTKLTCAWDSAGQRVHHQAIALHLIELHYQVLIKESTPIISPITTYQN
uniref:Chromo domain-containing protein n=1 Tax=Xenopus tropicalis TaxID=8364 RepID=A0A803KFE5_XENTR